MANAKTITFQMQFDPLTGHFRLEVQRGLWSGAMAMSMIERIIREEVNRRLSEPQSDKGLLTTDYILIHKLLQSHPVTKIPASAKQIKPTSAQRVDELLSLVEDL